jgi:hypothetical protein
MMPDGLFAWAVASADDFLAVSAVGFSLGGAAYVFESAGGWIEVALLKASNSGG